MDHLLHYIIKEKAYTANSGTIYLDLPKGAQISQLMVEARCGRGSTVDPANSILICMEKIHVLLDGAKVAYTMQPEVASFDYLLRSGKDPPHKLTSLTGGDLDIMRLPILFGRYPGDLEYGLDTARYGSASLEIEYTIDTADFATGGLVVTAFILSPVEPVSYRGFIRSRIIEAKVTPTVSTIHTVNFPSTYPLLAAFCRIYDFDLWPSTNVTDFDFQADQGRYRIFDGRFEDLLNLQSQKFGRAYPGPDMLVRATNSLECLTFMAMQIGVDMTYYGSGDYQLSNGTMSGHRIRVFSDASPADFFMQSRGAMPWGCLILGDWLDKPFNAPGHADLKCDFSIGATTPEVLTTCVLEVVDGVL